MDWTPRAGAPPVVCLDFDDTLCDAEGRPLVGAREAVARVRSWGYRTVLSSARFAPYYGDLNRPRMERIRRWLEQERIELDEVVYAVPDAAVYVDDRGHRFDGDWCALADELEPLARASSKARISIGLECLLDGESSVPGAREALDRLRRGSLELVVSAGPHIGARDPESGIDDVRERLQQAGLPRLRVEVAKIASQAYVSARAWPFRSDWRTTVGELEPLLPARRPPAPIEDGPRGGVRSTAELRAGVDPTRSAESRVGAGTPSSRTVARLGKSTKLGPMALLVESSPGDRWERRPGVPPERPASGANVLLAAHLAAVKRAENEARRQRGQQPIGVGGGHPLFGTIVVGKCSICGAPHIGPDPDLPGGRQVKPPPLPANRPCHPCEVDLAALHDEYGLPRPPPMTACLPQFIERLEADVLSFLTGVSRQASKLGKRFLDDEHILLHLLDEDACRAVFDLLRVDPDEVRGSVVEVVEEANQPAQVEERRTHWCGFPIQPGFNAVIGEAERNAIRILGEPAIAPEHLLLAVVGVSPQGFGAKALIRLGVDQDRMEAAVRKYRRRGVSFLQRVSRWASRRD